MVDKILEVGGAGIDGADAKVRALMNNIVNSETPGYKRSDVVIKAFPTYLEQANIRSSTQVPQVQGTYYDQTPGPLLRTGNSLDVAIGGDGFFSVMTPQGERYTRDGRFTLDQSGKLITTAGNYPVMGLGGQVMVQPGSKVNFTSEGKVMVDGVEVNTLKVIKVADTAKLKPITGSLFSADSAEMTINDAPRLVSGYVETSNSNIIEEYMNMIYLNRIYSTDSKIVANRETMFTRALDMGRPAQ
jgi:flagellar basal body rod protein FlgG